jgi:hypothetical protein
MGTHFRQQRDQDGENWHDREGPSCSVRRSPIIILTNVMPPNCLAIFAAAQIQKERLTAS